VRLSRALADAIAVLSRRERVTVFMTLLARSRRCCPDIQGRKTSSSGRPLPPQSGGTEPLIGFS
jgi:hypothetical protein